MIKHTDHEATVRIVRNDEVRLGDLLVRALPSSDDPGHFVDMVVSKIETSGSIVRFVGIADEDGYPFDEASTIAMAAHQVAVRRFVDEIECDEPGCTVLVETETYSIEELFVRDEGVFCGLHLDEVYASIDGDSAYDRATGK